MRDPLLHSMRAKEIYPWQRISELSMASPTSQAGRETRGIGRDKTRTTKATEATRIARATRTAGSDRAAKGIRSRRTRATREKGKNLGRPKIKKQAKTR